MPSRTRSIVKVVPLFSSTSTLSVSFAQLLLLRALLRTKESNSGTDKALFSTTVVPSGHTYARIFIQQFQAAEYLQYGLVLGTTIGLRRAGISALGILGQFAALIWFSRRVPDISRLFEISDEAVEEARGEVLDEVVHERMHGMVRMWQWKVLGDLAVCGWMFVEWMRWSETGI